MNFIKLLNEEINKLSACDGLGCITQEINESEDIDNENNTGTLYDLYYHLLILKNNNQLSGFTVKDFMYPDSFNIAVNDTNFEVKVFLDASYICTVVLFNNNIVKIPILNYNDNNKKHATYNSIINELFKVKHFVNGNFIKIY